MSRMSDPLSQWNLTQHRGSASRPIMALLLPFLLGRGFHPRVIIWRNTTALAETSTAVRTSLEVAVCIHGDRPVRQWRRHSFTRMCSLGLIRFGAAAALACISHPTTHPAADPHPLLCLDASGPVVPSGSGSLLGAEGRQGRSPSRPFSLVAYPADMTVHLPLVLYLPPYELFPAQEGDSWPISASLRLVLRL